MDPFTLSLLTMFGLALMGLSIGLAMLCGSFVYLLMRGLDPSLAVETMLQGLFNGYTLLAVPLFILAADLMNIGSLADRLLRFCQALVGRFKGGLGHVNVVTSVIFSGMSGSAVADAVGLGRVTMDMMIRDGKYTPSYAGAITAATAVIGPIIPPSIPMVLYALVSGASVGYLFAAGLLPGLLMALVMSVTNGILAHRRNFPVDNSVPLSELPRATVVAFPALMLPVILLGGIYGGIMTPTEAAAVAAAYALVISVVLYRSVSGAAFLGALISASRSTAGVGILIAGALAFNYVIARENIPADVSAWLNGMELTPITFLLAVNLLFLILGCILEAGVLLLIITPILIPTALALGIDPVHLGVVLVVNAMIGLITPPYGLLLFIVSAQTRQPMWAVVKDLFPFILSLVLALLFITLVPDFVLWLPRLLGYEG